MVAALYYRTTHKWKSKFFPTFTEAYLYTMKRCGKEGFIFRSIEYWDANKKHYSVEDLVSKEVDELLAADEEQS